MIKKILVIGSGTAGLLAAISLKRKIPQVEVRIIRSPDIGVIGVGEGTTPNFPRHLFEYVGINQKHFYNIAQPTWKIGIKFLWGPREHFYYTFSQQLDSHWSGMSMPIGFYCDDKFDYADLPSALMAHDKVFASQANGAPDVQPWHGFHIENRRLVSALEAVALEVGVEITDGKVCGTARDENGISAVNLEDGRRIAADFFIDSSGFRSELIGKTFEEPFVSYDKSLFCDRAIVGGWERTNEPILPYTTAETMDAGWSWQIEHEHFVNRGYVFSAGAISDDDACAEFQRKNPKVATPRVVKFRSGRYRNAWVDNVIAIGNAGGFVEPLEATALMVVCSQVSTLIDMLTHTRLTPTGTVRSLYNGLVAQMWDEIRDFLAIHYKANTRLDTPFWRQCREDTDVSGIQGLLDFYAENGPTGFGRHFLPPAGSNFGIEGFLVMLVGNRYPYRPKYTPTQSELEIWRTRRTSLTNKARESMDVKKALMYVRHPGWQWNSDAQRANAMAA